MSAMKLGWIKVSRFCELSGYTSKAVERKRATGAWPEGPKGLWYRAPDGNVHVHWERYQLWVTGQLSLAG